MESQSSGNGYKIAAIAIIWSLATGMLAICIPLVSITKSGMVLPLAVIFGVNWSTKIIWHSSIQNAELISNNQPLNERVVNLEAICSDEVENQKKLRQIDCGDND
jgi:hypothetical protein